MVVIGSRSKASSPHLILNSGKIWTCLCLALVSMFFLSLFLLWKATETTPTLRRVDPNTSSVPPEHPRLQNSIADNGNIKPVIGYAVSVTGCGSDPLTEGYVQYVSSDISASERSLCPHSIFLIHTVCAETAPPS